MVHGKRWTWVKYKCRCDACCAANDAYMQAYRAKNRAKILAREAERYTEQKARIISRQAAYYAREKGPVLQRQKRIEIRARRLMTEQRRKARKRGQFVEDVDPLVIRGRDRNICGICNEEVQTERFDVDHIVPLSRGGLHAYINTQLAHPECNRKKHNRLPTLAELERP